MHSGIVFYLDTLIMTKLYLKDQYDSYHMPVPILLFLYSISHT